MGFEKLPKKNGGGASSGHVTVACYGKGHNAANISIGRLVAKTLDWSLETQVDVAVGTGRDVGWIEVKPSDNGYRFSRKNFIIRVAALGDDVKQPATSCRHEIRKGALYIEMPGWMKEKFRATHASDKAA